MRGRGNDARRRWERSDGGAAGPRRSGALRSARLREAAASFLGPALLALIAALAGSSPAVAQEPEADGAPDVLRVFLECAFFGACDREHFRREIAFVDWVREPQDAQVHIIITAEPAGGGRRFTLDFTGRDALAGLSDQLLHTAGVTDVPEETVEALAQRIRLGLVRFAALAGFGDRIEIRAADAADRDAGREQVAPEDDPWDFWVFNVDGGFSIEKEDRSRETELGFGLSANRTTAAWKINVRAGGDFSREDFVLADTTVENDQDRFNASAFAVKTLGSHWGVGFEVEVDNSTRLNRELLVAMGSGLEWNFFPYSESTRRVLLARYVVSAERAEYREPTVFDLLEETVFRHEMALEYDAREPWGNARIGVNASQFLDRTEFFSVGVGGFVRYRIFRGLSVNVSGEFRVVEDQIFLPKAELSDEDVLLGRIQLPTESETELRLGLSYSFGSIFNNAVNTRFRRGVR